MRLVQENDNKIVVRVVSAARDPKTGKMTYVTFDSFEVSEAKPEEVYAAAKEGVTRASAAVRK